jgi:hypothetical protein
MRASRTIPGLSGGAFLVLMSACPAQQNAPHPTADAQACTRVGQSCEFSPGKLGSCVERDDCTQNCLVCQSQH